MKVVYLWKDGQQVLVFKNNDGEYEYPNEKWTEQAPPEGIYSPFISTVKSGLDNLKRILKRHLNQLKKILMKRYGDCSTHRYSCRIN